MSARCPSLLIRDAKEFTLVVLQNKQWHNAVRNVSPSSLSFLPTPMLKWEHCRDLIFKAGNEYRKFEIPSRRYPGMHVESVNNLSSYLHATLFPDEPRMTYLYDEDQDGIYVPLAEDNMNPETEAEYMWVHFDYSFTEKWKEELPHRIYLGGVMKNFGAEYGLLVSWSGFKSSVINETAKQFFEIRLWTHKEIIEEFLRYYDQMDDEIKELIPLKKIWVVSNDDQ